MFSYLELPSAAHPSDALHEPGTEAENDTGKQDEDEQSNQDRPCRAEEIGGRANNSIYGRIDRVIRIRGCNKCRGRSAPPSISGLQYIVHNRVNRFGYLRRYQVKNEPKS